MEESKRLKPDDELPQHVARQQREAPAENHDRTRFLAEDTPQPFAPDMDYSPPTPQQDPAAFDARPRQAQSLLSPKLLFIIFLILVLIVTALAGLLYMRNRRTVPPTELPIATTQTPQPKPLPIPTPALLDFSTLTVQVLNGSGITGEAGRVKAFLEKAGLNAIALGNAQSYDYTDTEVRFKEDTPPAVFEAIKKNLSDYTVIRTDEWLPASHDYDVQITVGVRTTE